VWSCGITALRATARPPTKLTLVHNHTGFDLDLIWITDPDPFPDPDRDTGKTCLGGGMHCPSASIHTGSSPI